MVNVYTSSVIEANAAAVWSRIRDFNALPQWHPAIADSRIENNQASDRVGCIRYFHTQDGGLIRERLLALSDYDYTFVYEILESPMGVTNYVATLKLTPITDGDRCFAQWSAEFDCAAGREAGSCFAMTRMAPRWSWILIRLRNFEIPLPCCLSTKTKAGERRS